MINKLQNRKSVDDEIKAIEEDRNAKISQLGAVYYDLHKHFREQHQGFVDQVRNQAEKEISQLLDSCQGHENDDWEIKAHEQVVARLFSAPDLSLLAMTYDLENRLHDLDRESQVPPREIRRER